MSETIEQKCLSKGVKLTDQRKVIAQVISESKEAYGESDHPDVDELYNRVSKIDPKISIAGRIFTGNATPGAAGVWREPPCLRQFSHCYVRPLTQHDFQLIMCMASDM